MDIRNDHIAKIKQDFEIENSKNSELTRINADLQSRLSESDSRLIEINLSLQLSDTKRTELESQYLELQTVCVHICSVFQFLK